jgi:uroporphyrinogen-III synthase
MQTGTQSLAGVRVLVTRPRNQAVALARLIEEAGGEAVLFPALEITGPADPAALDRLLDRLGEFDITIFVSRNAARFGLKRLRGLGLALPSRLAVAAVGEGTARVLHELGVVRVLTPAERTDSEGLLAAAALQNVAGRRVVIFRGQGGRELLAEELRARGALVEYAECYRRLRPAQDVQPLLERLARGALDIVTLTSAEALDNLLAMAGEDGAARLRRLPVVVVSARLAAACRAAGFAHEPLVSRAPSDEAIVAALRAWRASQNSL